MDPLLAEIETFRASHGLSETRFGRLAVNDPSLLPSLKTGREPRRRTVERIRTFMLTYKPEREAA
jgi:hypothetical protein